MTEIEIINTPAWGDLYLKFASEAEATEVLDMYSGSVDIIGLIEGSVGWHVNVRGPKSLELQAFAVEVATPVRVWLS